MKIRSASWLWREAWGEYLRYPPTIISLADWQTHTATLDQRMARGYDINGAKCGRRFTSISSAQR